MVDWNLFLFALNWILRRTLAEEKTQEKSGRTWRFAPSLNTPPHAAWFSMPTHITPRTACSPARLRLPEVQWTWASAGSILNLTPTAGRNIQCLYKTTSETWSCERHQDQTPPREFSPLAVVYMCSSMFKGFNVHDVCKSSTHCNTRQQQTDKPQIYNAFTNQCSCLSGLSRVLSPSTFDLMSNVIIVCPCRLSKASLRDGEEQTDKYTKWCHHCNN